MKVLVTGAAGFIGSYVARALVWRGDDVVGLDNFHPYYPRNCKEFNVDLINLASGRKTQYYPQKTVEPIYQKLASYEPTPVAKPGYFHFVEGDITDYETLEPLFVQEKFDAVVHLAAMAGVPFSMKNPRLYTEVNLDGTTNLLNLSVQNNLQKFIFASSSSIYGNSDKIPLKENEVDNKPISPYSATKLAGELICHTFNYNFKLPIVCLRFFTVYGPLQRPYGMVIQRFINRLYKGQPLTVYGDGSMARDYTYVTDTVAGILGALDFPCQYEIFNLGNSKPVVLMDLIADMKEVTGLEPLISHVERPSTEVNITYADITKARQAFNYSPKLNIKEGLTRQVEIFKMMPQWYQSLEIV